MLEFPELFFFPCSVLATKSFVARTVLLLKVQASGTMVALYMPAATGCAILEEFGVGAFLVPPSVRESCAYPRMHGPKWQTVGNDPNRNYIIAESNPVRGILGKSIQKILVGCFLLFLISARFSLSQTELCKNSKRKKLSCEKHLRGWPRPAPHWWEVGFHLWRRSRHNQIGANWPREETYFFHFFKILCFS